jgi:hypothetical protein
VAQLADGLPTLAAEGQWLAMMRALQFVLWLSPGPAAAAFIQARGTVRVQGEAAAGSWFCVCPADLLRRNQLHCKCWWRTGHSVSKLQAE